MKGDRGMTEEMHGVACAHACAWSCGRAYDVIVTQVVDNSTLMLCLPDFISLASNVAKAMTEPNAPEVKEVVENTDLSGVLLVTDNTPGYGIRGNSDPTAEDEFEFDGME